jgi:redox-sensing transcriptional repressor
MTHQPEDEALLRVPQPTIERLSAYLQCVRALRDGGESLRPAPKSRGEPASTLRITQRFKLLRRIRHAGLGYDLASLEAHLARIMGLDAERDVLLVGAGNLGRALGSYTGFGRRGFRIVAAFDVDAAKIAANWVGARFFI